MQQQTVQKAAAARWDRGGRGGRGGRRRRPRQRGSSSNGGGRK